MTTLQICIQNESTAMADLVNVLEQEQSVLTKAPTVELMEEINWLTQKKNQLIASLAELGKARNNELQRLGFKSQETTMQQWLSDKIGDKTQLACWEHLVALTTKAEDLNRSNGFLITRHLARNQTKLDVLNKLYQPDADPALYGANGQSATQLNRTRGVVV